MKLKYNLFIYITAVVLISLYFLSCKKYKDPSPKNLELTNLYCNDPLAVNYNWGFPGVPDNSKCIYASQVFIGDYKVYDSIIDINGIYVGTDSFDITIEKITDSSVSIKGFCGINDSITAKATKSLRLIIDTLLPNGKGQKFCSISDTINGFAIKQNIGDTIFDLNYNIISNLTNTHKANFNKK